jgi:hypothetical protein
MKVASGELRLIMGVGLVVGTLSCEALEMSGRPDSGVDPTRPSAPGNTTAPGGQSNVPAGGATPGGAQPTSIAGAVVPAEATPDCPAPVKAPAIGGALLGRLCSRTLANQCQPISGAIVGYHVKELAPVCLRGRTTTDGEGRFRLPAIEPASYGYYSVVFMAAGHLQYADGSVSVTEGRETNLGDVDLRTAAIGSNTSTLHRSTIAGRLCGRDGLNNCIPLAGASVGYRLGLDAARKIESEVKSDVNGYFALPNVEPASYGQYQISIIARGHYQKSETVPTAYPGSTAWFNDVELADAADGVEGKDLLSATIGGIVCARNTTGCAPVPGADVALLDDETQGQVRLSAKTDSRGRFGFSGLTPEARILTIRCQAPGGTAMNTAPVYGLHVGDTRNVECELRGQ